MTSMTSGTSGTTLARQYYDDVVAPLLAARWPDLPHAAGLGDPVGRGQLRARLQRPLRDQSEHDPLDRLTIEATTSGDPADRRTDPEPLPDPIQRPRSAQRAGVNDLHLGAVRGRGGLLRGVRNREIDETNRARATLSTCSARPKLWITFATEFPVSGCRSLWANCR